MILRKFTHQITPVKKCIQMQQKKVWNNIVSTAKYKILMNPTDFTPDYAKLARLDYK